MDIYDKKTSTFWNFLEEQELPDPDPDSPETNRQSSATAVSLAPSPCSSPWSLSPLRPSPSLLYHCLATLHRHDGNVLSLAVANGLVFTGSDSDRVRVWKPPTCADRGHIRTARGRVLAMLAHDDTVFTAHKDRRVRAWAVTAGSADRMKSKKIATVPKQSLFGIGTSAGLQRHNDTIFCLALFVREGLLYTASADRTVRAWKLSRARCVDCFVAHDGTVNAVVVSQENGTVFTGAADGTVKVWRRVYGDHTHAAVMVLRFQSSPVNALVLGAEGCLYSGSSDGYVNVWEKEEEGSGRYRHGGFLQGHRYAVLCLAAVGKLVMSGSEDATVRVWKRGEGGLHACVAVMEGHRGPVRCMAASLEGDGEGEGVLLYSASLDRMVKVWRMKVVGKEREAVVVGYEMNPVLSPMWVEKKRIHGGTTSPLC